MNKLVHGFRFTVLRRKNAVNGQLATENRKFKGFTLIELLTVIAIMSVLAGFTVARFDSVRDKARDTKRKESLKSVQTALVSYYQDTGTYPYSCSVSCTQNEQYSSDNGTDWGLPQLSVYLNSYPKDPSQALAPFGAGQASLIERFWALWQKPKSIASDLLAKLPRFSSKGNPSKSNLAQTQSKGQVLSAATVSPPGTAGNDTSGGTIAWSSPADAVSSNNVYATVTAGANQTTNNLYLFNFGFAIPAGSTINGIEVRVESKANNSNGYAIGAKLMDGATYVGNTDFTGGNTTTEQTFLKGSATALWGATWTSANINSMNFGVGLYATFGAGATTTTFSVDSVTITVYYSAPEPNLTVTSVTTNKSSYTPGEAMTITSTVQNSGAANVTTSFFNGYNKTGPDTAPTCSSITWNGYNIASLNAGTDATTNINTTAPTTAGTYKVGVYTDTNPCQITESSETDNYATSATYTVAAAAAPTADIKANNSDNPPAIPFNSAATLTWTSTNATSCTVNPGGFTGISSRGTTTGNLTTTTAYSIQCTGSGGTTNPADSVTVTVGVATPPTVTLNATSPVNFGATSDVNWSSTDTTSCDITGPGGGTGLGTSGSFTSPALTTDTTYSATCTGSGGSDTKSTTVTVTPPTWLSSCVNKEQVYCYVLLADRSSFFLYAKLENDNDPDLIKTGSACDINNPDKTSAKPFNYCIEAPK